MKKIKDENLNKYWWHRLYRALLWLGSLGVALGFAIEEEGLDFFLAFISLFIITFFAIALIYKLVLYVVSGRKISLNKKEKTYLIVGVIIIIIMIIANFIYYEYIYVPLPKGGHRF